MIADIYRVGPKEWEAEAVSSLVTWLPGLRCRSLGSAPSSLAQMHICLHQTSTLQENSGIQVRQLVVPSGEASESASGFSCSASEGLPCYIHPPDLMCLTGCPWEIAGRYNLCCRNMASVCEAGKCRDRKHSHDLLSTQPSCHGDYFSIYVLGFLTVLSEVGSRGQREAVKTIQECGTTADLVRWNTVLEKWKFQERSSLIFFKLMLLAGKQTLLNQYHQTNCNDPTEF